MSQEVYYLPALFVGCKVGSRKTSCDGLANKSSFGNLALVIMSVNSQTRGSEFESRRILDGYFSTSKVVPTKHRTYRNPRIAKTYQNFGQSIVYVYLP